MAFELVTAERPTIGKAPKASSAKRNRKPKAAVTVARPGYGPFGLAKGAEVDRILTEWNDEAENFLNQEDWVGLDLETSGLSPFTDWIAVVGLHGLKTRTAVVLHTPGYLPARLIEWLGSAERKFVTHNGVNFDILFLSQAGVDVMKPTWYDTLIGEQVVIATNRRGVSRKLQDVVKRRIGADIYKDVDHRDWLTDTLSEQQIRYVAEDISYLDKIRVAQFKAACESDAKWGVDDNYKKGVADALDLEHRLIPVVLTMQLRGLPLDRAATLAYADNQRRVADAMRERMVELFGDINWNSPAQVKKAFYDRLGVMLPSTQEDTLISFAEISPDTPLREACQTIVRYRHATKRAGMYNEGFIDKYARDGWLRSQFRQCGTDTGRFSSVNPNLQQLPKNRGGNDGARHIIGNAEGLSIVSADYSQIEVRIAASEAQDTALLRILNTSSTDIHTLIAARVLDKAPSEVTKDERQLSKAMSFTLLFGGGPYRLHAYAQSLGVDLSISRAQTLVGNFFHQFYHLDRMRLNACRLATKKVAWAVRFPSGLRRVLVPGVDLTATRILNNVVQGTAAAGLKYALLEMHKAGVSEYLGAVVHDETVLAVPNHLASEVGAIVKDCMIRGMQRVCETCPIEVNVSIGPTWE